MASFRIDEAARYLHGLAEQADSPALRRWLLSTVADLRGRAAAAKAIVSVPAEPDHADALLGESLEPRV